MNINSLIYTMRYYNHKQALLIFFIKMAATIVYANYNIINKVDPNCVMQMTLDFESLKMTEEVSEQNGMVKIQSTNSAPEDTISINIAGSINENDMKKVVLCLDNLEDYEIKIIKSKAKVAFGDSAKTKNEIDNFENRKNTTTEDKTFSIDTIEDKNTTKMGTFLGNITTNIDDEIDTFENDENNSTTTESGTFSENQTATNNVNQTMEEFEKSAGISVAIANNPEVFFGLIIPLLFILNVAILLGLILAWDWLHNKIFYKHITENAVRILPLRSNNNNTHTVDYILVHSR